MVYFAVSVVLYHTTKRIRLFPEWVIVLFSGVVFLVVTTLVENWLLSQIGWAQFFGGRSVAIGYLIAALFFALQTMLFYYLKAIEAKQVSDSPLREEQQELLQRIKVKKGEVAYFLELNKVVSATAYGNYSKLNIDGEVYLYGEGIGKFCAEYGAQGFLRIHRGHAVNEQRIKVLRQRGRQQEVLLTDGTALPVGAAYRDNLIDYS